MKKIYLIMFTVFLNLGLFSCSPQTNTDGENPEAIEEPADCCGNGGDIPPPPPGP
ncbi:hypothetical protein [Flavivirga sp. 57AJ16]|uniref:hypothetical protein n=1 Tax=Flavivirga sp. 57AJ16 TaxID=3025307 RepID=UPI002365A446|nr:hypothetical protein [Flavivirga sp. 57AJ16]MDD7887111.1 hypothetical protein [Flavivirga sp. 57AJ16]